MHEISLEKFQKLPPDLLPPSNREWVEEKGKIKFSKLETWNYDVIILMEILYGEITMPKLESRLKWISTESDY